MQPRVLRKYQWEAVNAVLDKWENAALNGESKRTSVVLATGLGKSTIVAKLAAMAREMGERTLILAHREELLEQIASTVMAVDPGGEKPGFVLNVRNEPDKFIVCASFQTLAASPQRLEEILSHGGIDYVLVDEAHHATAPTYVEVLRKLGLGITDDLAANPEDAQPGEDTVFACGFTATMNRADTFKLGHVWPTIAYERGLVWAIDNGFLVRPTGVTVVDDAYNKLATIKSSYGDYNTTELAEVMRSSVETTVEAIVNHTAGRASLVFAADVTHARELTAALVDAGLSAECVVGEDSKETREARYARFHDGETDILVTVMVLTEGADFPRCDCVVLARPTRSEVLFTQMVGRAVRPYTYPDGTEKTEALVIDLSGSAHDTRVVELSDLWGDAQVKKKTVSGDDVPELLSPNLTEDYEPEHAERTGTPDMQEIDLLQPSKGANPAGRTPAGVLFLETRDYDNSRTLFLWPPGEGESMLVEMTVDKSGRRWEPHFQPWRDETGEVVTFPNPAAALNTGRDYLKANGLHIAGNARWRKAPPSEAQLRVASRFRINPTGMSKGELSQAMTGTSLDWYISRRSSQEVLNGFGDL